MIHANVHGQTTTDVNWLQRAAGICLPRISIDCKPGRSFDKKINIQNN